MPLNHRLAAALLVAFSGASVVVMAHLIMRRLRRAGSAIAEPGR